VFVLISLVIAFLSTTYILRIVTNRSPQAIKLSTTDAIHVLNEGIGCGIVVGIGALLSVSLTQLISHVISQFRISLKTFYV